MMNSLISDTAWKRLEPHLPGRPGTWGGNARDNRQFVNAVFWILKTGAPWRSLPPVYGNWKNTHRRFCRWRDKGMWEILLEILLDDPDYAWLLLDSSSLETSKEALSQRYPWPWLRMLCHSESLLQKIPLLIKNNLDK